MMSTGLIDIMKKASLNAMDNRQLCDLRCGTVVNISPLKVQITNQFALPDSLLIVPEHLTDYEVDVEVDWFTENHGGHTHPIKGRKKMKIYNALKIGDKVALLRKQGGQSFFILDRI